MEVEMLTQQDCSKCEEAKKALQANGINVLTFSQAQLYVRDDRSEVMAELAINDFSFPVMRLKGSNRWTGSVQDILLEARRNLERRTQARVV